jgi:gluconokinase
MQARVGHYMPSSLLDSQLSILEPLHADEGGLTLDITQPPQVLVARITEST